MPIQTAPLLYLWEKKQKLKNIEALKIVSFDLFNTT